MFLRFSPRYLALSLFVLLGLLPCDLLAFDPGSAGSMDSRARLRNPLIEVPSVQDSFTVVSARSFGDLPDRVYRTMISMNEEMARLFGEAPHFAVSIELLDENAFFEQTGAPSWTNALYFDGRILVPVPEPLDSAVLENLTRSVKHEFTHAYIYAAGGGKCPGWLDEGIAQWVEGPVNPLLQKILARHLQSAAAIPMAWLQQGFTKLDTKIVGAAYGQSLFAANSLMRSYGVQKVGGYLALMRQGANPADAFQRSFNLSYESFEKQLDVALQEWAQAYNGSGKMVAARF